MKYGWKLIGARWECLECDTDAQGGTAEQVRGWARNHAQVTGHVVSMTAAERYEEEAPAVAFPPCEEEVER